MERHPSDMTPAELRCLREDLHLTVRAMSAAIGQTYQTITRWESGERPISARSAAALAEIVARTERAIAELVAVAAPDSVLITYRTDKEYRDADPRASIVRILPDGETVHWPASWHRMVVTQAAQQIPGARVDYYRAED